MNSTATLSIASHRTRVGAACTPGGAPVRRGFRRQGGRNPTEQQPDKPPELDVVVDEFELRGKKLGRLEIEAVNRGAGTVAREGGAASGA